MTKAKRKQIEAAGQVTDTRAEVEDYLQEQGVFYNGLRGEEHTAHMDSYMTCTNFMKLRAAWDVLKDRFSKEQWENMIAGWKYHAYCSPNCGIISAMFAHYMKGEML